MKKILLILIFPVLVCKAYSQEINNSGELENSLLWEISRNDLIYKSYLFGTNHIIGGSYVDTSSIIAECLTSSNIVITEAVKDDIDTAMLLQSIKMKDDEYYSFSDSRDEEYLKEFFSENSILKPYSEIYFILKPMFYWIMYYYTEYLQNEKDIKSDFISLDYYFMNKASEMNKKLIGFESVNEQMSFFTDSISIKNQLKILLETIRTTKENLKMGTMYLNSCYLKQDLNCMSEFMIFGSKFPNENKIFLESRNIKWMQKIPSIINYNSSFIAVGAAHLPGKYGLINLLRLQGYEVKPLKF